MTDNELIEYVYNELADDYLRDNVTDWKDIQQWIKVVNELPKPVRYTYLILKLDAQILNGGFIQYYDNNYGIFVRDTIDALTAVKAFKISDLLKKSTDIILLNNNGNLDFTLYILENKYWENQTIEKELEKLDNEYYELPERENLCKLLSDYLRESKIKNSA